MPAIVRTILFGVATGGRSQLPAAVLAVRAGIRPAPDTRLGRAVASRWVRGLLVTGAAGELVGDKLPQTPSRLQPPGLAFRVLAAAAGSVVIAEDEGSSRWLGAVIGGAAALAGSFGGAKWRATAAIRFGRDWPGAVIEDAAVATLAVVSARRL
jgi:uncharacterized membrane protein